MSEPKPSDEAMAAAAVVLRGPPVAGYAWQVTLALAPSPASPVTSAKSNSEVVTGLVDLVRVRLASTPSRYKAAGTFNDVLQRLCDALVPASPGSPVSENVAASDQAMWAELRAGRADGRKR